MAKPTKKPAAKKKVVGANKKAPAEKPPAKKTPANDALDFKAFKDELKRRFRFDRNGSFKAPDKDTFLVFVAGKRRIQLSAFNEIPIEDVDRHFKASAIMDAPGTDEIVHVTEPGKYFNHVFWNDHERGLYSIDCIEDYEDELDMDEYSTWSKDRRIKSMPFFESMLATSLEKLLEGIRVMSREDFYAKR